MEQNKSPLINNQSPTPSPSPDGTTTQAIEEQIDIEYFSKIKLRLAKIESAQALPKSKKLLKLQVDLGPELGKRQILAGIAQHYAPENLVGKQIVVVANLKPAQLMGEVSQGMLLAASTPDNLLLGVLSPDKEIPPGAIVR